MAMWGVLRRHLTPSENTFFLSSFFLRQWYGLKVGKRFGLTPSENIFAAVVQVRPQNKGTFCPGTCIHLTFELNPHLALGDSLAPPHTVANCPSYRNFLRYLLILARWVRVLFSTAG